MTQVLIPDSYLLVPSIRKSLWCLVTGRKMELEPADVRPGVTAALGSARMEVKQFTDDEAHGGIVRFGHYTASLSREDYLRLVLLGNIIVPSWKVHGTVQVTGSHVSVSVFGAGGGSGEIVDPDDGLADDCLRKPS